MKKLAKILAVVLAIATLTACLCFTMTACNKKDENLLVVGITDYEPYDFEVDGEWTGFDAEVAKLVAKELGYDGVKFELIDWDNKIVELQSGKIDCIWNGMTMTDDLAKEMIFSKPYATNYQVAVYNTTKNSFADLDAIKAKGDLKVTAENGSAGEDVAKDEFGQDTFTPLADQLTALNDVNMGTSDVAVVDCAIALAKCGKGSFANLAIVNGVKLSEEQFAIGFRKADTELKNKVDALLVKYYADGTLSALQQQFGAEAIALTEIK